jgi:hypothetical protein
MSQTADAMNQQSVSPSFVVSLMPFERQLLAEVACADHLIRAIVEHKIMDDLRLTSFQTVFDQWGPVIATKEAIRILKNELWRAVRPTANIRESLLPVVDPDEPDVFSQELRKDAFRAFFASLETPRETNSPRAQSSKHNNPWFQVGLLSTENVLKFLESITVGVNEDDWFHWKILMAMFLRCPDQMTRWLFDVPGVLQVFTYRNVGFEIVNVLRMYFIHLRRPQTEATILQLCESNGDLGSKLWSSYCERQAEVTRKCERFLGDNGIAALFGVNMAATDPEERQKALAGGDPNGVTIESKVNIPLLHRSADSLGIDHRWV